MKILITTALKAEAQPIIDLYQLEEVSHNLYSNKENTKHLFITGIGLIRSSVELSDKINKYDYFINIGTCGSLTKDYKVNDLVEPKGFIQGDFDGIQISDEYSATAYDPCDLNLINLKPCLCSVNRFMTERIPIADIVDMEGYSFVALMKKFNKPYKVIKIVSDTGDTEEFTLNVTRCINHNLKKIVNIIERSSNECNSVECNSVESISNESIKK